MIKLPIDGLNFLDGIVNQADPLLLLSVITKIELLSFKAKSEETDLLNRFVESSIVLDLSKEIVHATIEIRKSRKIKIPDAVIAATAIVFDFTLLTRNMDDFKGLMGLKIVNPWELNPT